MVGMSDIHASIFNIIKKKNYFMLLVMIIGFVLQIIVTEIPILVDFFSTTQLNFKEWIWICLLSLFPLVVHEIIK